MSDLVQKGVEMVRQAESLLRELMQFGVNTGDYERVRVLANWAERLSQIGGNGRINGREVIVDKLAAGIGQPRSGAGKRRVRGTRSRRGAKYPVFRRSRNELVKIAWSRASKTEYQHHAPKTVVVALLRKMQLASDGETLIAIDELMPLSVDDQGEVPAYKVYTSLAWLRWIGAVKQHGRQGYSVPTDLDAQKFVEHHWLELPGIRE